MDGEWIGYKNKSAIVYTRNLKERLLVLEFLITNNNFEVKFAAIDGEVENYLLLRERKDYKDLGSLFGVVEEYEPGILCEYIDDFLDISDKYKRVDALVPVCVTILQEYLNSEEYIHTWNDCRNKRN